MTTVRHAVRALVRSPLRSVLVIAVLAVSVGLTLIMITVNEAFSAGVDEIRSEVGTNVTVRPAGSFGGGFIRGGQGFGPPGGGDDTDAAAEVVTLMDEQVAELWALDDVVAVSSTITVPYIGEGLESPPPQFPGGQGPPGGAGGFQRPVLVTGTDSPNSLVSLGGADVQIASGRTFEADEADAAVAVVGATLAEANALAAGSTFEIEGTDIEVVGVFTTGTQFGDNAIFLPLITAQTLFARAGEIDEAIVQAASVDEVEAVAAAVQEALGAETVDVTTQLAQFDAISAPLSDAESSSRVGMIAALVASAAVILFSVGLLARQRVKEIGILKSIGASNWRITSQFGIETVFLSVTAAVLGALATFPLAQTVADGLVSDPAALGGGPGGGPGGGRGFGGNFAGGPGEGFRGQVQQAGGFLGDVDVAVSPEVFLFAIGIGIVLAVVASAVPAWYAGRVKPAEVLRYE